MVEPTVTAPERDVLLATKLHMPAAQPAQVYPAAASGHD